MRGRDLSQLRLSIRLHFDGKLVKTHFCDRRKSVQEEGCHTVGRIGLQVRREEMGLYSCRQKDGKNRHVFDFVKCLPKCRKKSPRLALILLGQ